MISPTGVIGVAISKKRQKLRRLPRGQLIAQITLGCSRAGTVNGWDAGDCNFSQFFVNSCSLHVLAT
jgi:hypothetical protein